LPDSAACVRFLGGAEAHARHGAPGEPVETIETHMSWVFLAGTQALKLKKPVRYPFLDFSTREAREAACREEVRLNARLAPGIYRGLMVLQWRAGALSVVPEAQADPQAATLDWLVWMQRLPAERMLDRAIAAGTLQAAEIDELADLLSAFYRRATVVPIDGAQYTLRFQREQAISREVLLRPQFRIDGATEALDRLDAALQCHAGLLAKRASEGRVVDGHGDLRPEHVCLLQPPVVVDCLEFNPRLRQVDPLDELAFLALECTLAGAPWVGTRLRGRCAAALHDDAAPTAPWLLYTAYRALLRARLAMAHLLDPQPRTPQRWAPLAQRYVGHALQALQGLA
jgi:aminoglycoside phosphotransferase family enzyme